jgi:nucleotide-binding universal stress UspA family protein
MVATDGSAYAVAAIEWLNHAPLPASADLMVAAVAEHRAVSIDISTVEFERAVADRARAAAAGAISRLQGRWPTATMSVVTGDPREEIVRLADTWAADLVVMGTRGLGTVERLVLGSVSAAVVHAVHCAVLVVKGHHASVFGDILLAVDGSPNSLAAVRFVTELAAVPRVRVLAVVEPPYVPRTAPSVVMPALRQAASALVAEQRAEHERLLAQVAADLSLTAASVATSVAVGRPHEEIVKAASQPDVGLVVVGARGLGAIRRMLLGSTSEYVLHEAGCPVLIVKQRA